MRHQSRRYTGSGVEVRAGARHRHHSNLEQPTFAIWAVCDSLDPESWHGEVLLGASVLLTTGATGDEFTAGRLAERLLEARMVEVFGGGGG